MKNSKPIHFLLNTHIGIFLLLCFLSHFFIEIFFLWVPDESKINSSLEMIEQTGGKAMVLFASVVLAPAFETLIYQFSIIKLLQWIINNPRWSFSIAIPVSAALFALDHPYSLYYQVSTFLIGLLYATIFYLSQYRKDWPAFLVVLVLHASWNLFAFIVEEI